MRKRNATAIAESLPVGKGTEITVTRMAGEWARAMAGYRRKTENWCRAALPARKQGSLSIVLADDAFVSGLNAQFRGKPNPTNVLSFPGNGDEIGDIILAFETVKREAHEQGKSFSAHTAHLIVHGTLHLLGFDHEEEDEAERMERKEITILKKLGFTNPYEAEP